jgi:hypothetical protein
MRPWSIGEAEADFSIAVTKSVIQRDRQPEFLLGYRAKVYYSKYKD